MSEPTLTEAQYAWSEVQRLKDHATTLTRHNADLTTERDQARAEAVAATTRYDDLRHRIEALEAAVDRVRRRHPRGDEESSYLAPGLWCPTCGRERTDNGRGGCPDRNALIIPGRPLREATT